MNLFKPNYLLRAPCANIITSGLEVELQYMNTEEDTNFQSPTAIFMMMPGPGQDPVGGWQNRYCPLFYFLGNLCSNRQYKTHGRGAGDKGWVLRIRAPGGRKSSVTRERRYPCSPTLHLEGHAWPDCHNKCCLPEKHTMKNPLWVWPSEMFHTPSHHLVDAPGRQQL